MSNTTLNNKTTSDTSKPAPRAIPTAPEAVAKSPVAKPTAVKPETASVKRPAPAAPAPSAANPAKATVAKAPSKPSKRVPVKKPAAKKPAVKASAKPIAKSLAKSVAKAADSKPAKTEKPKKAKLVRDSFTIPKDEYVVIDALKQRAGKLARSAKKSELLRAGIKALAAMSDEAFVRALAQVPAIKTGRPSAQA